MGRRRFRANAKPRFGGVFLYSYESNSQVGVSAFRPSEGEGNPNDQAPTYACYCDLQSDYDPCAARVTERSKIEARIRVQAASHSVSLSQEGGALDRLTFTPLFIMLSLHPTAPIDFDL